MFSIAMAVMVVALIISEPSLLWGLLFVIGVGGLLSELRD